MEIKSFQDMYVAELQELASMERQLADTLLWAAEIASRGELKQALADHREESLVQLERLETLLLKHKARVDEHTDQAMQGLIGETEKMMNMLKGPDLRDAGLIASMQKLEHYEIAAYGTAAALAGQLDLREEQARLHKSLDEERQIDAVLTQLAKGKVNPAARAA